MEKSLIQRIQDWYKNNCDSNWEHNFGFKIETLDNPGWSVEIDLEDTSLEEGKFYKKIENGENDWLIIKTENKQFIGMGDPYKLNEIFRTFLDEFFPLQNNPEFLYQIYIPILNAKIPTWQAVDAKLINESIFEIVRIEELQLKNIQVLDINDFNKINDDLNSLATNFKEGDKVLCELKTFFDSKELAVSENLSK